MTEAQTLLLDQSYRPIRVVSWKKAISLLFSNKIEIVELHEEEIRSVSLVIKIPAVARLVRAFKRPKQPVRFSRVSVAARDGYKCQYCLQEMTLKEITLDHVLPRQHGGKTTFDNIVTCCNSCNLKKANRTPEQAGMELKTKPVTPKWLPAVQITLSRKSAPDCWKVYLTDEQ